MDLNEYSRLASRTLGPDDSNLPFFSKLSLSALGLAGESGEVVDIIKKILHHGHPVWTNREKLLLEAGDILWYLWLLCETLESSLNDIAEMNILKLQKRYPNGFNHEDSINRVD